MGSVIFNILLSSVEFCEIIYTNILKVEVDKLVI